MNESRDTKAPGEQTDDTSRHEQAPDKAAMIAERRVTVMDFSFVGTPPINDEEARERREFFASEEPYIREKYPVLHGALTDVATIELQMEEMVGPEAMWGAAREVLASRKRVEHEKARQLHALGGTGQFSESNMALYADAIDEVASRPSERETSAAFFGLLFGHQLALRKVDDEKRAYLDDLAREAQSD
jgi:hypothetical protein